MSQDKLRAFVALDIGAETRDRIAALIADLRPELHNMRLVPIEQLHLTLRFLGDIPRDSVAALGKALEHAAAVCPQVDVALEGIGTFPERGHPRVLWLGLALPEPIFALQAACEAAAQQIGLAPEPRPFRPHLTLGRWRSPAPRPALPPVTLGTTRLSRIVLYESQLGPGGATHTPLGSFALGSAS
jgi:RNA 2',3'-cyclic 3'-phosphodiesterase